MNAMYLPAAPEILAAFEREVRDLGGDTSDVYAEGDLLFARAVLPRSGEARSGDWIHAGVAVRTHDTEILVHPYTYRVVCTNGMIAAVAAGSQSVERVEIAAPSVVINAVLEELRTAIRAAAAPVLLDATIGTMRAATQREADIMLQLMPLLPHRPPGMRASLVRAIVQRFESGRDGSVFGLVNAVTSVAHDTTDPETRWRLEELGGGMLARLLEQPKPIAPAVEMVESVYASAGTATPLTGAATPLQ